MEKGKLLLKCMSTSSETMCATKLGIYSYPSMKNIPWWLSGYERPTGLIALIPIDVEDWSGTLTWLLFGTILQCNHYSLGSLLHQYCQPACPPLLLPFRYSNIWLLHKGFGNKLARNYSTLGSNSYSLLNAIHSSFTSPPGLQGELGKTSRFSFCSWTFFFSIPF